MRKEIGFGLLLLAGACAPLYLPAYELSLLGRFLALAVLALGISLIWGTGGILSLGQGVFFGLGGYALAMHLKLAGLEHGTIPDFMQWSGLDALPWWWAPFHNPVVAIAAVFIVPGLAAAALAYLVFRRRVSGPYFAIITQALALAATTFIISQQQFTGGFNGLTGFTDAFGFSLGDPHTQVGLYWITLAALAVAFVATRALQQSAFGKVLLAIRDGENRVRFLGYDPLPFKVIAFAVAGVLAGISGALVTLDLGVISPAMFGVVPSIEMVIWVALGGRYSLLGAILGTLVVNFGKDWISSAFPDLWLYVVGAVFVLVVTVAPQGLLGLTKLIGRPRLQPSAPPALVE
ncbi:MAG: urea ABC transporter permease subunit UrtC [Vulcanimicrobiaceae bacterium]